MKKSIGSKIIITYLVILLVSFGAMGLLFNSIVRSFLIREVENGLEKEAILLAALYKDTSLENIPKDTKVRRTTFRLANRLFEGDYFVVDLKANVIYSNNPKLIETGDVYTHPSVKNALQGKATGAVHTLKNKDLVSVSVPLKNPNGDIKGAVVSFTELKGVQKLGTSIIQQLLKVLLIVSIFTILLGIILARSISKPIKMLEAGARRLGARDFDTRIAVHTGDELEQLSNTFNHMARELKNYYLAQKKFLQNASHELKTPLMSIQGYAEGIKDGVLTGEEKDKGLEIIIAESNRLKNLVNQLIYLSKLETLEEVYELKENDLGDIIRECFEKVEPLAQGKNVQVKLAEITTPVMVNVDREKIIQALINLFSNGIRFADSQLDVLLKTDINNAYIEFNDNGPGIQEKDINHIFDRFYIGREGDTGLGLAITKAIVEKHGGKIKARNNHSGASIKITLPRKK